MSHSPNPAEPTGHNDLRSKPVHLRSTLLFVVCAFPALAGAAPHPNAKVLAAVKVCEQSGRELLERVVAIDSGTGDVEGLNAVGATYASEFKALGADVKAVAPTPPAVGN